MRLHEFEAKQLFQRYGIPVPSGRVVASPPEAARAAGELRGEVVVKAQVLAGGRGKAGGVRMAASPEEAERLAGELLGSSIRGLRAGALLVEERLGIARELYLGITVDGSAGKPAVLVGGQGGVDIEETAATHPEEIVSEHVDPLGTLSRTQADALIRAAGLAGESADRAADLLCRLYRLFAENDALIAEINPLALLECGGLSAADAVVEIDDAALFRHPEWNALERISDPRARKAREQGMTYVGMEGEIGLICSGAGLGMATMDLIAEQARPANFLETGGGITRELMASAMRLVLDQPGIEAVLINVYGGINPIHEGARGVAEVLAEGIHVPVVAKALGNHQEATWEILRRAGVEIVTEIETEKAVQAVLRRLRREEA